MIPSENTLTKHCCVKLDSQCHQTPLYLSFKITLLFLQSVRSVLPQAYREDLVHCAQYLQTLLFCILLNQSLQLLQKGCVDPRVLTQQQGKTLLFSESVLLTIETATNWYKNLQEFLRERLQSENVCSHFVQNCAVDTLKVQWVDWHFTTPRLPV